MISRPIALLIAAALPIAALPFAPAPAQAPSAAPDPAALALARFLMTRDETLYDDADITRFRARIERELATMEGACDPFQSECRGAAVGVAQEFAPAVRLAERARTELITAYLLADTLSPGEMTRISAFLESDEGRRFLDAWAALRDPEHDERRRRELQRAIDQTNPDALAAARRTFRQRTRNLPRALPR